MHKIHSKTCLVFKDPYSNDLQVSAENINLMGLVFLQNTNSNSNSIK